MCCCCCCRVHADVCGNKIMLHLKSSTRRIFCNTPSTLTQRYFTDSLNATWCGIENRVLAVCVCVCLHWQHFAPACVNFFAYVLRWRPGAKRAGTHPHSWCDSTPRGGELRWSGVRVHPDPDPVLRPWHPGEHSSVKVQGSVKKKKCYSSHAESSVC